MLTNSGRVIAIISLLFLLSCQTGTKNQLLMGSAKPSNSSVAAPNLAKCFGFELPISYYALDSSSGGRSTIFNALFGTALQTKYATRSVVGKIGMNLQNETLLVSIFDEGGNLVVESMRTQVKLLECGSEYTKFTFEDGFSGDGGRAKRVIVVALSLKNDMVLIETLLAQRSGWLFLSSEPELKNYWSMFRIR